MEARLEVEEYNYSEDEKFLISKLLDSSHPFFESQDSLEIFLNRKIEFINRLRQLNQVYSDTIEFLINNKGPALEYIRTIFVQCVIEFGIKYTCDSLSRETKIGMSNLATLERAIRIGRPDYETFAILSDRHAKLIKQYSPISELKTNSLPIC